MGYQALVQINARIIHGYKVENRNYKWYPVYTHPRAEKKAHQALSNKGIETYLPLRRQLKQWSDRKKWVDEPFIKSYLFVHISPNTNKRRY